LPFLAAEHQQQVAQAVERAKQVTMPELNAIIGVRMNEVNFLISIFLGFGFKFFIFCKKFL
jgi:hypothetical protein